jgi:hypothetical protein
LIFPAEDESGEPISGYLVFNVDLKSFMHNKFKFGIGILVYTLTLVALFLGEAFSMTNLGVFLHCTEGVEGAEGSVGE